MNPSDLGLLLKISKKLLSIQERKELLHAIFTIINNTIPFDDCGLFVLDETGKYYQDLVVTEGLGLSINDVMKKEGLGGYLPIDESVSFFLGNKPVIITFDELINRFPGHPFLPFMKEAGLKQILGAPLIKNDKTFGFLALNSFKENHFTEEDFPLVTEIAYQLAIATDNVLTREKLEEEKRFKETLLAISDAVSVTQNRSELLKILFDVIQPVFPFDAPGLFIINEEQHTEILDTNTTKDSFNARVWADIGSGPFDNKGTFVQKILENPKTYLTSVNETAHPHINVMLDLGLKQMMYTPLVTGGKIIGVLIVNSKDENTYKPEHILFFEAIADQIAIAVSNILANESLLEEKQFTEKLLKISKAVASIQDSETLLQTIAASIKPIFPYDELGVFINSADGKYQRDLAVDLNFGVLDHFPKGWLPRDPGIDDFMFNGPMISTLSELQKKFPGHPHYQGLEESGYKQVIGGPLKPGKKRLGLLCFWSKKQDFYSNKDLKIFKAIADQLSVAVSNVLAGEELKQNEQEKDIRIRVTDAMNIGSNWAEKFKEVAIVLKDVFPLDMLTFGPLDKERKYPRIGLERIGMQEFRAISLETFIKHQKIDPNEYEKFRISFKHRKPRILNLEDIENLPSENIVHRNVHEMFGINSMMLFPIRSEKNNWYFSLFSKTNNAFKEHHLLFMDRLLQSFQLALDKALSLEEIENLNVLLKEENQYLEEEISKQYNFHEIVGTSEPMQQVFMKMQMVKLVLIILIR